MICREVIVAARWRRGSASLGSRIGYAVPRTMSVGPLGAGAAWALITVLILGSPGIGENGGMQLGRAQRIVAFAVSEAPGPLSVYVADTHGELVAAATMDGAAPDTRLNAQRKAYTAARSDARTTR